LRWASDAAAIKSGVTINLNARMLNRAGSLEVRGYMVPGGPHRKLTSAPGRYRPLKLSIRESSFPPTS
jgi:hypothetical protein